MSAVPVITYEGKSPLVEPSAWVAPNATVVGDVTLMKDASVWYTAVIRAEQARIVVGAGSNIQDGCIVHADPRLPVALGAKVSVGHRAVIHGCTVEDEVLIGMGAVILNGCHIHTGSVVAAGTVITEATQVPPNSLVVGVPGRIHRNTTEAERSDIRANAEAYQVLMRSCDDPEVGDAVNP